MPDLCGEQNLALTTNGFLHGYSIDQIAVNMSRFSCGVNPVAGTNHEPQIVIPNQKPTIPANTPFVLTTVATDPDAQDQSRLSYSWEQLDLGYPTPPDVDDGRRPLFRNFDPSISPTRYFPSLQYILNNDSVPPERCGTNGELLCGEMLPKTERTMTFRLVTRDNRSLDGNTAGTTSSADVTVTVAGSAGPFR